MASKPKKPYTLSLRLLSSFDDILTDVLVDKLFYWTNIRKVHPRYQSNRAIKNKYVGEIIRNHVCVGRNIQAATDKFLAIDGIGRFANKLRPEERSDFVKHLKRYVEIYHPETAYEVSSTNRYTLKSLEASVVARTLIKKGETVKNLSGVMVTMTKEEEEEFTEASNRDFSIIHSSRKAGAQIFLGPARFVNHDCSPNCRFMSASKSTVMFRTLRDIQPGEELTVYYSDDYFGPKNADCLCQSCEKDLKGGWSKCVGYMEKSFLEKRKAEEEKDEDDYAGRAKKRARKSLPTPALSIEDEESNKAASPPASNFAPNSLSLPTPAVTPAEVIDGSYSPTPIVDLAISVATLGVPKTDVAELAIFPEAGSGTSLSVEVSPTPAISPEDDGYESDLSIYSDTDMEILNAKYKFGPLIKVPPKPVNPDPKSLPQIPEGIRYPGDHLPENAIIDPRIELRCTCQNYNCQTTFIFKNEDPYRFHNHIPRCCPRCERHSIVYGLVWPKTILRSDDHEVRVMNPEDVERDVNLARYRKDLKMMEEWRVENLLKEAFKKNLRRENRKLDKKRRKTKGQETPGVEA